MLRKLGICTGMIAALMLPVACGSDSEDDTTTEETSASHDDDGGPIDLSAALLTADDVAPEAEIEQVDVAALAGMTQGGGMAEFMEDMTIEPADCQENDVDPFSKDGVEAKGMSATFGGNDGDLEVDVLMNAVYSGAESSDLDGLKDRLDTCGEVSVTNPELGVDMTMTMTIDDAPPVDAEEAAAFEFTPTSSGEQGPTTRIIYLIDGGYGVYVAGMRDSANYDLDQMSATALEKLRTAQG